MIKYLQNHTEFIEEINIKKKSVFHIIPDGEKHIYMLASGFAIEKACFDISKDCVLDIIGPDEYLAPETFLRISGHEYKFFFVTNGIILKFLINDTLEDLLNDSTTAVFLFGLLQAKISWHKKINICKSISDTDERILSFLSLINKKLGPAYRTIPITRSELACMTGLRTETVIRAVKKLEREQRIFLNNKGEIIRSGN